jgi:DNA-directed RNA polymerase subunit RPC12/RpoP
MAKLIVCPECGSRSCVRVGSIHHTDKETNSGYMLAVYACVKCEHHFQGRSHLGKRRSIKYQRNG